MKHLISFFLIISVAGVVEAQDSAIGTANITFEFPAKNVDGTIGGFQSNSIIDLENPAESSLEGSVQSETLDTNNFLRNWSLRGGKYFDVKTYPKISFKSHSIQKEGDTWIVLGDLTLKGITKSFRIDFEHVNQKLVGYGELYSSDFNINIKKVREDNLVVVRFELELTE